MKTETLVTHTPGETEAFAAKLAAELPEGSVLALYGNLGAGKTVFARGFARGLGITEPISSPTFTILQVHDEGRMPLYHFDWYRIEDANEIYEMGMEEQLGGDGIALIEWSEKAAECLPVKRLRICIRTVDENTRDMTFVPEGGFAFEENWLK